MLLLTIEPLSMVAMVGLGVTELMWMKILIQLTLTPPIIKISLDDDYEEH